MGILFVLCLATFGHAETPEVWMKVGEVKSFAAPSGKAVRVGSRGVIKVIDGESSVRVVALKPGNSPLVIGAKNFTIRVTQASQKDFVDALRGRVSHMKGLQVQADTRPLAVVGTLLRFADWERLAELAREHQGEYVFKAQALPDVAQKALTHFHQLAKSKGFPVVRFRADPEFTAQIPQAAGHLQENAAQVFKPYGISVRTTNSDLMLQPLVRTRVILAELSRSQSRELGVTWPSEYNAQLLPNWSGDDNLMATLRALEQNGQAQILASPNLICRSGSEAKFHAGGEFPIKMFSHFSHDVIWKQHGVLLDVKPEADFQGAISLEIETEVSLLDWSNAVDGIPRAQVEQSEESF